MSQADEYIGRYYSIDWVRKTILHQTEEEISKMDAEMQKDISQQPQQEEEGQENDQQY